MARVVEKSPSGYYTSAPSPKRLASCPDSSGTAECPPPVRGGFPSDTIRAAAGLPAAFLRALTGRAQWAVCLLALLAGFALALPSAPAAAQAIWSATLTADLNTTAVNPEDYSGCTNHNNTLAQCSDVLSPSTFTFRGRRDWIRFLRFDQRAVLNELVGRDLNISFGKPIPKAVRRFGVLTVDSQELVFADRTFSLQQVSWSWDDDTRIWTQDQRVSFSLTLRVPDSDPLRRKYDWCFNRDGMSEVDCASAVVEWEDQAAEIDLPASGHCPKTHARRVARTDRMTGATIKCQQSFYYDPDDPQGRLRGSPIDVSFTDPGAASTVTLSASPNPVREGAPVTVTATLSAALSETVTIRLAAAGTGGFGAVSNIVIPAGETGGSVSIDMHTDADGNDESFTVSMDTQGLPASVTAGGTTSVTITITDPEGNNEVQGEGQGQGVGQGGGQGQGGRGSNPVGSGTTAGDPEPVVIANAPATGAPTITGTPQVGATLTADTTGITDPDGLTNPGYLYQWLRGAGAPATPIAGATARTYVPRAADRGQRLRVRVAFTDDRGVAETLTSAATAAVDRAAAAQPTVKTTLAEIGRATLTGATDILGQRFDAGPARPTVTLAGRRVDLRAALAGEAAPEAAGTDPLATPWREASATDDPTRRGPLAANQGVNLAALLGNSAFTLPLAGDGTPGGGAWTLWGRGTRQSFAGQRGGGSWDGSTWSGWLGVDARLSDRWLAGAAVSHSAATTDYRLRGTTGDLETALTTAWPYVQMALPKGGAVRLLFGAGRGEARHRTPAGLKTKTDLTLLAGVLGVRQPFAWGHDVTLAAVADANLGHLTADGAAGTALEDLTVSVWRVRGGVEAQHAGVALGTGAWRLAPRGSLAARQDGGHGVTGTGLEVAGGVSLVAPDSRFGLTADGYWLALHSATGRRAWGASLEAQLRPAADGLGLALALGTQLGLPRDRALDQEGAFGLQPALGGTTALALTAQAGYGVRALTGILTPFAGVALTGRTGSQARGGLRWEWTRVRTPLGALGVAVVGEHRELAQGPADQRIGVQVQIPLGGTGPRLPARAGRDGVVPPRDRTVETADPVAVRPPNPTPLASSSFSALSGRGPWGEDRDEGAHPLRAPRHEPAPVTAPVRPRRQTHVPAHQARTTVSDRPAGSAHLQPAPRARVRATVSHGQRYFVQLGAFTSPAIARRAKTILAGHLTDVLRHPVALVASRHGGVTRVLVAAAFRTSRAAAGLCAAITASGPACKVVTATPRPRRARTPG